jgi:transcriptional regulator with XRE-family HTH domain
VFHARAGQHHRREHVPRLATAGSGLSGVDVDTRPGVITGAGRGLGRSRSVVRVGEVEHLVGRRLATARRRRGLSQLQFADLIRRSESWVSKVETGAMRLDSLSLAQSIAELLGVSFAHLVAVDAIDQAGRVAVGRDGDDGLGSGLPGPLTPLLIGPGDVRMWDDVRRRWFFAHSSATVIAVLDVLRRQGEGDLGERLGSALAGGNRIDAETLDGLEATTLGYRQAYRSASGLSLLGPAHGTLTLLVELAGAAGSGRDRVVSLIGQMAGLVGTLLMLDLGDFEAAARYLTIAARAAEQAEDRELLAFALGCRAFHAAYSGTPSAGLGFAEAGLDAARAGIHPRTHGWVAAVASEMYAATGSASGFRRALGESTARLERAAADQGGRAWAGIGLFNEDKLTAYFGTGLVRLGHYRQAQAELSRALERLDPALLKHRCTAHIDLAEAYARDGKVDEGAEHLMKGLDIIADTQHAESLRRVTRLNGKLREHRTPAVRRLGHRLRELEAMT